MAKPKGKVTVTITGPVSSGKSIVMDRIAKLLENEFNIEIMSSDLFKARNLDDMDGELTEAELKMIREKVWELREITET